MCFASTPSIPTPQPVPPPPSLPDQGVKNAAANQDQLAAMEYGAAQTVLTGPEGLQQKANTTAGGAKTLG